MKPHLPSLNVQIIIGLVAGIAFGLFFGKWCDVLQPAVDAFIKIMQITVLPSVVVYIIAGIGSLNRSIAREMIIKGAQVLLLFWMLSIFFYFAMQFAFPNLPIASFFSTSEVSKAEEVNLMDVFIPSNPFHSLAEGSLPGVVLFCLLLGFALIDQNKNKQLLDLLRLLEAAISSVTRYLMRILPIGVFVVTANVAGTITFEHFLELEVYFVSLVVVVLMLTFLVLPITISWFSPFRYREILSAASKALILGFSTGNVFITIPLIVEGVERLFKENAASERIRSINHALVPIVFTFPSMGGFPPLLFILFAGWYYQNSLNAQEQALLVLAGIPSLFGASYLSVPFLLDLMHLPSDAFELFMSSKIIDIHFTAALSCMSIFSFTAICVALLSSPPRIRIKKMVLSSVIMVAVLALIIMQLNFVFAHLLANTYQGGEIVNSMERSPGCIELSELIDSYPLKGQIGTKVYFNVTDVPPARDGESLERDVLKRIKQRGALRVGYNANCIPFVYFNNEGKLVGYDVEMAYDLARFLNVSRLEFVPVTGDAIAESLNSGFSDIVMEAVIVTPNRLKKMIFTNSYMTVHLAFVVKNERKNDFSKLDDLRKLDNLTVAVLNKTAAAEIMAELLPKANLVKLDRISDFFKEERADALLSTAEEGQAMTLLYPCYDVSILEPSDDYKFLYAYPIAKESGESFILLLNYWLEMKKQKGDLDNKYNYWILGKEAKKEEPRWCVISNVLHCTPTLNTGAIFR